MCCMVAFEVFDFMLLGVFDLVTVLNAVYCGFLCVCLGLRGRDGYQLY